jgi:tRNA pseudouridine38-40 synthase
MDGSGRPVAAPSRKKSKSAIFRMTGRKARLIGSGRTDAGVHALGQAANFHCDTRISPEAFRRGITAMMRGKS